MLKILNARLETLQQDEVLTRLEQPHSLLQVMLPLKIWIFGALKLKYPTSPVMESLGLHILFSTLTVSSHPKQRESSWHSPKYIGILAMSFFIRNKEKPQLQVQFSVSIHSDGAHQFLSASPVLVLRTILPWKLGANLFGFSITSLNSAITTGKPVERFSDSGLYWML